MQDTHKWFALYDNGELYFQVDAEGNKHAYEDIDRQHLAYFFIYENDKDKPLFCAQGKDIIWRRRVSIKDGVVEYRHIVGKPGRYVAVISSGNVMLFNDYDENEALLAPPELLECEK